MISTLSVFLTLKGELCTEDDPDKAFLLVRKGCFIDDGKARTYKLAEFIESQNKPSTDALKIIPAPLIEEIKSLQILKPKRGKK